MARKKGLGMGLAALIPEDQNEPDEDSRGVDVLVPNRRNSEHKDESTEKSSTVHSLLSPGKQGSRSQKRSVTETASKGKKTSKATGKNSGSAKMAAGDADEELAPVPGIATAEVPLDQIIPNRMQPRQEFDQELLEELRDSIKEVGVIQPMLVSRIDPKENDGARYELIAGERRWRAMKLGGFKTGPVIIREKVDDETRMREALLENLHRVNLNPLEEAAAYQQLMEHFGCTQEILSKKIARSRPQIANTLRLLKLPVQVQTKVAAGVISAGHARALLGLSSPEAMKALADRIISEGLSVRSTEEIVALGEGEVMPAAKRSKRAPTPVSEEAQEIAESIGDFLDTRVKVQMGRKRGRIVVEFAGMEDLQRIAEVISKSSRQ